MEIQEMATLLLGRLDKLEDKLNDVKTHAAQIDVTLAKNTADVAYHIARTDALQERVEQVAEQAEVGVSLVAKLKGAAALVSLAAALAGIWHYLIG